MFYGFPKIRRMVIKNF